MVFFDVKRSLGFDPGVSADCAVVSSRNTGNSHLILGGKEKPLKSLLFPSVMHCGHNQTHVQPSFWYKSFPLNCTSQFTAL